MRTLKGFFLCSIEEKFFGGACPHLKVPQSIFVDLLKQSQVLLGKQLGLEDLNAKD